MRRWIAIMLLFTMPASGFANCQSAYRAEAESQRGTWFLTMFMVVPGIVILAGYGHTAAQKKQGLLMAVPMILAAGFLKLWGHLRAPKFDKMALMLDHAENPGGRGHAFDEIYQQAQKRAREKAKDGTLVLDRERFARAVADGNHRDAFCELRQYERSHKRLLLGRKQIIDYALASMSRDPRPEIPEPQALVPAELSQALEAGAFPAGSVTVRCQGDRCEAPDRLPPGFSPDQFDFDSMIQVSE